MPKMAEYTENSCWLRPAQPITPQYSLLQPTTAQFSLVKTSRVQYSPVHPSTAQYSPVQHSAVHYSPPPPVQVKVYHHVYISTLSRQSFAQKHPGLVFMSSLWIWIQFLFCYKLKRLEFMRKANLREGEAKGSQLKGDQRKKIQMRKFLSKKMRVHFKIKGISILKLFDVSLNEKKSQIEYLFRDKKITIWCLHQGNRYTKLFFHCYPIETIFQRKVLKWNWVNSRVYGSLKPFPAAVRVIIPSYYADSLQMQGHKSGGGEW